VVLSEIHRHSISARPTRPGLTLQKAVAIVLNEPFGRCLLGVRQNPRRCRVGSHARQIARGRTAGHAYCQPPHGARVEYADSPWLPRPCWPAERVEHQGTPRRSQLGPGASHAKAVRRWRQVRDPFVRFSSPDTANHYMAARSDAWRLTVYHRGSLRPGPFGGLVLTPTRPRGNVMVPRRHHSGIMAVLSSSGWRGGKALIRARPLASPGCTPSSVSGC